MASKIGIYNMALSMLGNGRGVLSPDEDSKAARLIGRIWDNTRDEVLRDHPWNFANRRARLSRLTTPPVFQYQYAYQKPVDCVRALIVGEIEDDIKWEVEGDTVVTNESECFLLYTARIEDCGRFDAKFATALAARIAFYIALSMTASTTAVANMDALYSKILSSATGADGQEGNAPQDAANEWIQARQ